MRSPIAAKDETTNTKLVQHRPSVCGVCYPTIRDLDFRKVLPLLPEPEFPQPVFRAVAARLVGWMVVAVVAVVPAPTLEPVSLHFRQPWLLPILLNPKKRHHSITHAQLTVRSLFDTAMQLLGPSKIWSGRKWPVASHKQCNEWNEEACQAAGAVVENLICLTKIKQRQAVRRGIELHQSQVANALLVKSAG